MYQHTFIHREGGSDFIFFKVDLIDLSEKHTDLLIDISIGLTKFTLYFSLVLYSNASIEYQLSGTDTSPDFWSALCPTPSSPTTPTSPAEHVNTGQEGTQLR